MQAQCMHRAGVRPLQRPAASRPAGACAPAGLWAAAGAAPACSRAAPALSAQSSWPAARPAPRARGSLVCRAAQAGALPAPTPPAPTPLIGIKWPPALAAIAVGLAVHFLVPVPAGVTPHAWQLFSMFITTIVGLVLGPLPVGAWAFVMLTTTLVTKTLSFKAALAAMTNEVIWLIVVSFFFAKGFEKTGLGERIANLFVMAMGKSTLGLAYGLMIAETVIAPAMPSSTARAGGIFMPIIKFLSKGVGSEPDDPSRKRLGAYLVQSQLQCSLFSSAVFLTSGGQNLLCMEMGAKMGAVVENAWVTWFIGAVPPAVVGLAITPLLLYKLYPPEVTATPEAPAAARKALEDMGPMSRPETVMLAVISAAVVLWVAGEAIGVSAVVAAMLGLSALLITGVLTWRDCLEYGPAWDTLFWFAVLISMSGALNDAGLITVFADAMGKQLTALQLGWIPCFILLQVAFFVIHYLFASQTAHIASLFSAFLAMCIAAGAPPVLSSLVLAYNGNLFGNITHFASGQSAIYYGAGYCTLAEYFYLGAVFGFLSLALYLGIGMPWWKFLGWW